MLPNTTHRVPAREHAQRRGRRRGRRARSRARPRRAPRRRSRRRSSAAPLTAASSARAPSSSPRSACGSASVVSATRAVQVAALEHHRGLEHERAAAQRGVVERARDLVAADRLGQRGRRDPRSGSRARGPARGEPRSTPSPPCSAAPAPNLSVRPAPTTVPLAAGRRRQGLVCAIRPPRRARARTSSARRRWSRRFVAVIVTCWPTATVIGVPSASASPLASVATSIVSTVRLRLAAPGRVAGVADEELQAVGRCPARSRGPTSTFARRRPSSISGPFWSVFGPASGSRRRRSRSGRWRRGRCPARRCRGSSCARSRCRRRSSTVTPSSPLWAMTLAGFCADVARRGSRSPSTISTPLSPLPRSRVPLSSVPIQFP